MLNTTLNDKLNLLSDKEREYALQILNELSKNGKSNKFEQLLYEDYEEIPVNIETFLHDPQYLGKALTNEEGKFTIYPYWEKTLKDIFPTNLDTKYNTAVFTGGIGLGKSTIAVIAGLYMLYRMMCLKNPYLHYGLQDIDLITFAFVNITLDAAKGVAWDKCQQLLQRSPWFMQRGTMSRGDYPTWKPPKGIELITGSLPRHFIGRCVFFGFIDEVSFQPNQDIEKQRQKASELVNSMNTRMQSRFMKAEKNPTLLALASSKRTEQSYLEVFIENKKKNESKTTLVVDEPQWVIRTDKDSPNKFWVAIGNKFLDSETLPLDISETDLAVYRNKGYTLLQVPFGYREAFVDDIDQALTDIAGISTSNVTKYISGPRLLAVKDRSLKNPFSKDIIEVGNAPGDTTQYWDFFDLEKIPKDLFRKPLFIHLDMSVSGDKTGIAGVWIRGKKPPQEGLDSSKELFYQLAFSVAVKAPKGYQISFEKNRQFIRWLRQQGFNIKGISSDTFQSVHIRQMLEQEHFNTCIISVDRVDAESHVCLPYQYMKSAIYEERFIMYDSDLVTTEFLSLERNGNGKVDHPQGGSKDTVDAITGAVWNASQYGDQYAFDYGENIETITKVSSDFDSIGKQQITADFEAELRKIQDPLNNIQKPDEFKDFGLGRAQVLAQSNLSQGILVW